MEDIALLWVDSLRNSLKISLDHWEFGWVTYNDYTNWCYLCLLVYEWLFPNPGLDFQIEHTLGSIAGLPTPPKATNK